MDLKQIKVDNPLPGVLEEYHISLRRAGRGFIARCPFHDDQHPSLSVYLGLSGWQFRCWGGSCGKSGDLFDFVGYQLFGDGWDNHNDSQFKDVLQALGASDHGRSRAVWKTAISSTPTGPTPVSGAVQFAWEIALSIYGDILQKSPEAREYLKERRLSLDVIRKYRFGYCPVEGSPLLAAAGMRRLTRQDLEAAGLYRNFYDEENQPAGSYEFLKGRIIFADVDLARNPVYLVGRALPCGGLKETAVKYLGLAGFQKPLFGYRSLGSGQGPVFLLEGPLDKLTLENWGYDALALMAANPSPGQIRLLQGLNRPIVPIRDNDEAGEVALSTWQEAIPWLAKPLELPEKVDGVAIKDPNDLAAKLPESVGKKIFADLCKRRKLV